MRRIALLYVLIMFGAQSWAANPDEPAFEPVECPIEIPPELGERIRCGTVSVPRDYERPQDGDFKVAVLVGQAKEPSPGAEPIFVDFGGWSASNIRNGALEVGFRGTTRNVVIIDKRGAGFSTPQICPPSMLGRQIAAVAADLTFEDTLSEMRAALLDCRADMAERGLKPEWFGVRTSSRDLDRVRQALGYEQIVMVGVSHGGRQALDYIAAYPNHVSAAVVDSPSLPDPYLNLPSENFDRALGVTFEACAEQPSCAERFPDLPALYQQALQGLDEEGLAIPVPNAPGGVFVINGADFELLLQQMLYTRQGIAMVPTVIEAAASRQAAMLMPVVMAAQSSAEANGEITGHIFECRDRPSLHAAPPVERGSDVLGNLDRVCENWTEPGVISRLPEDSPVPVLVLSGRFDPVTPPAYGEMAANAIGANATYVVMPYSAHGVGFTRCIGLEMIPAFFDDPQADLIDCTANGSPIAFATPPRG